jgi:hypothetical protein
MASKRQLDRADEMTAAARTYRAAVGNPRHTGRVLAAQP